MKQVLLGAALLGLALSPAAAECFGSHNKTAMSTPIEQVAQTPVKTDLKSAQYAGLADGWLVNLMVRNNG